MPEHHHDPNNINTNAFPTEFAFHSSGTPISTQAPTPTNPVHVHIASPYAPATPSKLKFAASSSSPESVSPHSDSDAGSAANSPNTFAPHQPATGSQDHTQDGAEFSVATEMDHGSEKYKTRRKASFTNGRGSGNGNGHHKFVRLEDEESTDVDAEEIPIEEGGDHHTRGRSRSHKASSPFWTQIHQKMKDWHAKRRAKLPVTVLLLAITYYGVGYLLFHDHILPGSPAFSLIMIVIGGATGGLIAERLGIAPLLGMLIGGIILRNILPDSLVRGLPPKVTGAIRNLALTIILSRAGLGLQRQTVLKNAKRTVLLAIVPLLAEATMGMLIGIAVIKFPVPWAYMQSFALATTSPGVVVPLMLGLAERKLGMRSGTVPMMLAAVGLDVVFGIVGFSICAGIVFGNGKSLLWLILQGPIEIIVGLAVGLMFGGLLYLLGELDLKDGPRTAIGVGVSAVAVLAGKEYNFAGASTLTVITMWCVAANTWKSSNLQVVSKNLKICWEIFQPFMFPIIGSNINFATLTPTIALNSLAIIFGSLITKMIATYCLMWSQGVEWERRVFVAGAYTGKATVQAALSSTALEGAIQFSLGAQPIAWGEQILTTLVLAILCSTSWCALFVRFFAEKLLEEGEPPRYTSQTPTARTSVYHANDA
ncbi:Sodium/hydrogen exchanger 9B2, partial [Quaeritorhiza haematococci]